MLFTGKSLLNDVSPMGKSGGEKSLGMLLLGFFVLFEEILVVSSIDICKGVEE